jgi:branched-chain amino acid transport system substrate-binding protein
MRSYIFKISVAVAALLGPMTIALSAESAQASTTESPITLAYITDLTGPGAAENAGTQAGFLARIDLQNARGGINGHKLVPLVIDDQTSPAEIATAVQLAISKGAFGIVSQSPLFSIAAKYPLQAGMPVTGTYNDGPEWGEQPYTNMFASDVGSVDPKYPVNTLVGSFLKDHGGTVIGSYGYGIAPQSAAAARGAAESFQDAGGKIGLEDTSVPYGSTNFTAAALSARSAGVNAIAPDMDNNSNFALTTALNQNGVKLKAALFATGYEPSVINSPVWSSLQGDYFLSGFRPWSLPDAGTKVMQAAMEKYAHLGKNSFATYGENNSWLGADLMIKGLLMAGSNPTRAAVIKDLRSVKAYNGNGLLPITINYSTIFGHDSPSCSWVVQAHKSGFAPIAPKPFCGHDVPGTTTLSG